MHKFPFRILSDIVTPIRITPSCTFRQIQAVELPSLFGYTQIAVDPKGLMTGVTGVNSNHPLQRTATNDIERFQHFSRLFTSNFLLEWDETASDAELDLYSFDKALRLIRLSGAGLSYGFIQNGLRLVHPSPFANWLSQLTLNNTDIPNFSSLFHAIKGLTSVNSKKIKIMLEKYVYSTSSEKFSDELGYMDICTVLEMLLFPKPQTTEISYQFRLRMAKLFNVELGIPTQTTLAQAKSIYNIRSKLVHEGETPLLQQGNTYVDAAEICRKILEIHVRNPTKLTQQYFETICLG